MNLPCRASLAAGLLLVLPYVALPAVAEDGPVKLELTLKDHRWTPAEVDVPAGRRIMITVKNLDSTAEEFDSSDLEVEKVIVGGGTGIVRIHPLQPGRYKFMGEYHPATAQGVVVAK